MAIPSRVRGAGTFFVTSAAWERRRVFQVEANARLFLEKLEAYRENYLLHAYVVMPDHVHLLITPGKLALERAVQLIKGGFSHALASKFPVWQRGFSDVRGRDARDAAGRIRYVEENPLGAHLAQHAWEYPFSSASPDALKLDALPAQLRMPPQGLKPRSMAGVNGTAEAVPFQRSIRSVSVPLRLPDVADDILAISPQGLKPQSWDDENGTAEAVPLRIRDREDP